MQYFSAGSSSGRRGLPIADATVTLYRERATAMVRRSSNDRIFAFQNVPRGFPFYDPKFLDAYRAQGTLVTVEGSNAVVPNIVAITVRP